MSTTACWAAAPVRADELVTAVTGTIAAISFIVDHLWGLCRRREVDGRRAPVNPLVITSAVGIAALILLLLLSVIFSWPAWLIRDAMGVLATVVFPFAQIRTHQLRRREAQAARRADW